MISRLPGDFLKKLFYFFKLLPLVNWAFVIEISQKSIMARTFRFGQQIQNGEVIFIDKLLVGAQCFINIISSSNL